ncbi:MAG TPA: MXAN_5187 C-terminal domain-containing protein, partial [Myxococcota bacterium]
GVRRATLEDIADAPGVGEVRPSRKPTQSIQSPTTTATTTATTPQPPPKVPAPQPSANASTMALLPTAVATKEPVEPSEPSESTEIPRAVVLDADGVSEPRPSRKATKKAKKAAAAAARAEGSTSIPTAVSSLPSAAPPVTPPVIDEPTPAAVDATLEPVAVVEMTAPAAGEVVVEKNAAPERGPEATGDDDAVSTDTVIEPAPALELPTRDELQKLFDEFLREKKAARQIEGLDVDFDAFAETIRSESERLVAEHHCRGVRFEVAVAEGEVSLRPRLIR